MSRHTVEFDYLSAPTYDANGKCTHNSRCRYTTGFYCEDCNTFISKDSDEYRKSELLSSYWMVLHNINAERLQQGLARIKEVQTLSDKIGIGKNHDDDFEQLIAKAQAMVTKYGKTKDSATVTLR